MSRRSIQASSPTATLLDRALGAAAAVALSAAAYHALVVVRSPSSSSDGELDDCDDFGNDDGNGAAYHGRRHRVRGGDGNRQRATTRASASASSSALSLSWGGSLFLPAWMGVIVRAFASSVCAISGGGGGRRRRQRWQKRPRRRANGDDDDDNDNDNDRRGLGDDYYLAAYASSFAEEGEVMEEDVRHEGSCHCGAVRFTLLAPPSLVSLDCPGKIRYPHHCTSADKFELMAGAEQHLKVYYVALGNGNVNDDDDDDDRGGGIGGIVGSSANERVIAVSKVAAHAFCDLCGVHVLRAPDASTDELEVNVGCVDFLRTEPDKADAGASAGEGSKLGHRVASHLSGTKKTGKGIVTRTIVRYYEDPIGGMGAGTPLFLRSNDATLSHKPERRRGGNGDVVDMEEVAEKEIEEEEGEEEGASFESAVRNVFGITESRHGRWHVIEDQAPLGSEIDAGVGSAARHHGGGSGGALVAWQKIARLDKEGDDDDDVPTETPSTSATSSSDHFSFLGGPPVLPRDRFRHPLVGTASVSEDDLTGEDDQGEEEEDDAMDDEDAAAALARGAAAAAEASSAPDSIDGYSAARGSSTTSSAAATTAAGGIWRVVPPSSSSTAAAASADQLRYYMKRHLAA